MRILLSKIQDSAKRGLFFLWFTIPCIFSSTTLVAMEPPSYEEQEFQKFKQMRLFSSEHYIPMDLIQEISKTHRALVYKEAEVLANKVNVGTEYGFETVVLRAEDNPNNLVLEIVCKAHPEIKWMSLYACTGITNLSPLRGLRSLESMSIHGCIGVKNLTPLHELINLTSIVMNDCIMVKDLTSLYGLKKLTNIYMRGHMGARLEQIQALKNALPGCKIHQD